ncbi:MAG: dual specificity protein phosphatase family protein [Armatimonadota bacterium]|nr:dual specificity protein phosphatase family protein [Armatimonadota bacterium]
MASDDWRMAISWVIEGEVAAFSALVLRQPERLQEAGIGAIVSLTEDLPSDLRGESRFEVLHLPIQDMTPPDMEQVERYVRFVDRMLATGRAVGTHCLAGLGRTGTMIACYLVSRGYSAEEAIRRVRDARPGAIQTETQERAVARWEMIQSGDWDAIADFL